MSVQAGIWNFDGKPVDRKFLATFSESLRQQGPDDESYFVDGSVALIYRPFHTTSESRLEKQPYRSASGFVITWDGRIDNRDDLIPGLHTDIMDEKTDIAIVAAAFERWGTDCFHQLVGEWAISIWRPLERELILACDFMAIRHIFYHQKKQGIRWSTDLAPLVVLSGDKFHIDDDYMAGYFANDPDCHLTPYREIRQVPAGQFVRIRNGSVSVQRYWLFNPRSRIRYKTDAEYEEHFRHVFRQSVRRRLRSDSPVLAELSGGLDSSSIVCMADDILAKEGAQAPRLDTLSYYDKSEPDGDDWIYFQKIEKERGRVGCHIDASKYGESASLRYPLFSALPGYLGAGQVLEAERSAAAQAGCYRVTLSGIGGDEFLGGIPDPRGQLADLIVQFRFVALAKQLMAWSLAKRKPWMHLLWQASVELLPLSLSQYIVREAKLEHWVEKDFARRTKVAMRQLGPTAKFRVWLPTGRSYLCGVYAMSNKMAKHILPQLVFGEIRYPYLDLNLVEFLLSIPARQLLRPGERRSLMRRSLRSLVPNEILSRRTKQWGARTNVLALEKNREELEATLSSMVSSSLGYVNRDRLVATCEAARNGKTVHAVRLMKAIALEFWLRDMASRGLLASVGSAHAPLQAMSVEAAV